MKSRKYPLLILCSQIFLTFFSSCSSVPKITERPCEKNVTVTRDKNGIAPAVSEPVSLIEKNDSSNQSPVIYFQGSQNKYWLSFMQSFGNSSRALKDLYLVFTDSSSSKLENSKHEGEMVETSHSKYTNSFFVISDIDIYTLTQKNIKTIKASLVSGSRETG